MSADETSLPGAFAARYAYADPAADTYDQRSGRCYELAVCAQLAFADLGWTAVALTHGHVGPHENPHAWLEFRGGAGEKLVWDGTLDQVMDWRHYRDALGARRWASYDPAQARSLVLLHRHFGVWTPALKARYDRHVARMDAAGVGYRAWEEASRD